MSGWLGLLVSIALVAVASADVTARSSRRHVTPSPVMLAMDAYETAHPRTFHIGGEVTVPKQIVHAEPQFPSDVLDKRRLGGVMMLEAIVDEHGVLTEPVMMNGADPELQPYVLKALQKWRYHPARLKGKPVPVFLTATVNICVR